MSGQSFTVQICDVESQINDIQTEFNIHCDLFNTFNQVQTYYVYA